MAKRLFNFLLPAVILILAMSSFVGTGILFWSKDHKLNFSDFKGKPTMKDTMLVKKDSLFSTHKLGTISQSIDVKVTSRSGITTFSIHAAMKEDDSWIKDDGDSITLKHQQGHFDICEIYARVLRKEIKKATTINEAQQLFHKISNDENEEQDRYDSENNFRVGGIIPKWKVIIKERLKALEQYENPVVILPIRN